MWLLCEDYVLRVMCNSSFPLSTSNQLLGNIICIPSTDLSIITKCRNDSSYCSSAKAVSAHLICT